ncbi:anaphase-promoting complex subunit 15B-like [Coccinella septempunctata]|uniref:anaphase-promoting complex subunit 15B-like n=1 Tax=Coccinella septempunctata TaxID=41139 RepID=UPI001D093FC9|nr:anaphase-promoting complex subunit 15B-like [Coccinella septempunctata]
MNIPLFPTLKPRLIDSLWFQPDTPCNEEEEVNRLEKEHRAWITNSIRLVEMVPIGNVSMEANEEDEEEDDEDDNDDEEESESHDEDEDDEIELEPIQDLNSTPHINGGGLGHAVR